MATHSPSIAAASGAPPVGAARVFSGWRVLAWCTLAIGLTAPGQTIGVAVFIDHFVSGLGISRVQVSGAYLLGTVLGALTLPAVGRAIDRRGVRASMAAIGVGFGAALVATGAVQGLVTLAIAFVGIRALGQGGLSLVGQTGVTLWFERRRGLALAIALTVSSGIMALAPLGFALLIDGVGWRAAWTLIGVGIWVVVVPIALFGVIDRPSDVGQTPDGGEAPDSGGREVPAGHESTVAEALRSPAFWSVTAVGILTAAFVTGVTFHHFAIMSARGFGATEAAAVFVPQVVGLVGAGFAFAWAADRIPGRVLLPAAGGLLAAGLALATIVTPGLVAVAYGLLLGATQGAIRSTAAVVLPRWFGVANIGAIRGIETAVMVGASAVGPLIFALGSAAAGGYAPVLLASALLTAIVAGATVAVGAQVPSARPGAMTAAGH